MSKPKLIAFNIIVLLLVLVAFANVPVVAKSASGTSTQISELPPQGLYDSCVIYHADCVDHLNVFAEKGFKLVLNYGQLYGTTKQQLAYADRAHSLGMQVIWAVTYEPKKTENNWMLTEFDMLAADTQCLDNECLIRYFVNLVKDHPATWGYYVADEAHPSHHERLKAWSEIIKETDPDHPRLFVTAGTDDPMEHYWGFYAQQRDVADVFGPDYYPYGYLETGTELTRHTGDAARQAQAWADQLGGQSAMVLQAFDWASYWHEALCAPWPACAPFPTMEQMKAQRDQTLQNSRPALILWWTYEAILNSDDPVKHWNDLASAAFAPPPPSFLQSAKVVSACPSGWECADIGAPKAQGYQTEFTIYGAGWDINRIDWQKADQFHYVWQLADDESDLSAKVVGKPYKAGLMFRSTIDPISPYYAVYFTQSGIKVEFAPDFGELTQTVTSTAFQPYLKISRVGINFSAYTSQDGTTWSLIPDSNKEIPALSGELMIGLAVTSGDETVLDKVTFDQVVLVNNGLIFQAHTPTPAVTVTLLPTLTSTVTVPTATAPVRTTSTPTITAPLFQLDAIAENIALFLGVIVLLMILVVGIVRLRRR